MLSKTKNTWLTASTNPMNYTTVEPASFWLCRQNTELKLKVTCWASSSSRPLWADKARKCLKQGQNLGQSLGRVIRFYGQGSLKSDLNTWGQLSYLPLTLLSFDSNQFRAICCPVRSGTGDRELTKLCSQGAFKTKWVMEEWPLQFPKGQTRNTCARHFFVGTQ